MKAVHRVLARTLHAIARLPTNRLRWLLIGVIGIFATLHIGWFPEASQLDRNSYDQMVKRRLIAPPADPSIIIVDIDERSLDKMKDEFGRWPWPRETLAGVLDWLRAQQARAVVFDILFADPDTMNPASDAAFVQSVQASDNTFFPILRLNPDNDAISVVRTDQLPGFATPLRLTQATGPTLAVVPPMFEAIVASGRMGYHNIYADEDGVNRYYHLWQDKGDWRLWSLPARLAQTQQWPLPERPKQLIQYTRTKDAYTRVSFEEIWQLSQTRAGQQRDPRFDNAIVIIGATATSLFDVKVTPLHITHPGVMVLANVIDNLKNQRFLKEVQMVWQLGITWAILLLMGWATYFLRQEHMTSAALAAPSLLVAVGYLSLNSGMNVYVDLVSSASHAVVFFTVWTLYLTWRVKFFSDGDQLARAFGSLHAKNQHETFAVFELKPKAMNLQHLLDVLPPDMQVTRVLQLEAMGQPKKEQQGLIYVVARHAQADALQAQFQALKKTLSSGLVFAHISMARSADHGQINDWQNLWADVVQAKQKGNQT
jgi:CHASE2 domain-containing sensor protein